MTINTFENNKIINFYGRTTGHIGKKANSLLENLLPKYALDLESVKNGRFYNLATKYKTVNLEIGFGSGDFIFNSSVKNPDNLYLGVEVFLNGVASLLDKIENSCPNSKTKAIPNLHIYNGNVYHLLEIFKENIFDNIYILFPDPWPKLRHHKRRLINQDNLSLFSKILNQNGNLRFVSDHYDYVEWSLENLIISKNFSWEIEDVEDFKNPPLDHFETKYERKAKQKGIEISYINCKNMK